MCPKKVLIERDLAAHHEVVAVHTGVLGVIGQMGVVVVRLFILAEWCDTGAQRFVA
jgi:hypothetical protein